MAILIILLATEVFFLIRPLGFRLSSMQVSPHFISSKFAMIYILWVSGGLASQVPYGECLKLWMEIRVQMSCLGVVFETY